MAARAIQVIVTLVAVGVAAVHMFLPSVSIDAITVTLLLIAVLPWLRPLFKSVELPGGVKVEFQDLQKAKEKVESSGLLDPKPTIKPMQQHVYAFQSVAGQDANLALAGLRIEIESRLREIAGSRGQEPKSASLHQLLRQLESTGALAQTEASAIRDLLPLLNSAAHGAKVDPKGFDWAMEFGPRVLGALEDRLGESSVQTMVDAWMRRDGGAQVEVGTELSKAFVRSPEAFVAAMTAQPSALETWLQTLENNTFTIFESRGEVEDELYIAYYERLRQLMIQAAESLKSTKFAEAASQIAETVRKLNIKRIW